MQKRKKWSIAPALSFFLMAALILSGQGMKNAKIPLLLSYSVKKAAAYTTETYFSGNWIYQLDENENAIITGYTGAEEEIVLDQIDGKQVVAIEKQAFINSSQIKKVIFAEGVERIGAGAFENCYNLQDVSFPTTLTTIEDKAFKSCKIESVCIPVNLKNIGDAVFGAEYGPDNFEVEEGNPYFIKEDGIIYDANYSTIVFASRDEVTESIVIPDAVEKINGYVFNQFTELRNIYFSKNLKYIGEYAFYGCKNVVEIQLPEGLEYIGDFAFGLCNKLIEVTVPQNVTEVGISVLYENKSLTKVTIEAALEDINSMCGNCSALQDIQLPENLRVLSGFYGCYSLKELTIPETVECIRESAFVGTKIESLMIPEGVKEIDEGAIYSNDYLKSIEVAEGNESYYVQSGMLFDENGVLLTATTESTEVEIPTCCTRIGKLVFIGRNDITKVVIPDSVREIGERAFQGCEYLSEIVVGDEISKMESGVFHRTAHYLDEENWENGIYYLGNYALESDEDSMTSSLIIKEGCTLIADNICLFNNKIEKLILSESMKYIGKTAFGYCQGLQAIIGGKKIERVGEMAFYGNISLESIYIGGENIILEKQAFAYCSSLKTLVIYAENIEYQEDVFTEGQIEKMIVPNLESLPERIPWSGEDVQKKIAFVNIDIAELFEKGESYFGSYSGYNIYLDVSASAFQGDEYFWLTNNNIYFQDEFYCCSFFIDGRYLECNVLAAGEEIISPIAQGEDFAFTSESMVYSEVGWDIDADGIKDTLPEQIDEHLEAHAVYEIVDAGTENDTVSPSPTASASASPSLMPATSTSPSPTITASASSSPTLLVSASPIVPTQTPVEIITNSPIPTKSPEPLSGNDSVEVTPVPDKTMEPTETINPPVIEGEGNSEDENNGLRFQITSKAGKGVLIEWELNAKAERYIIYRSTKKQSDYKIIKSLSASKGRYRDKKALSGRKYYYQIIAIVKKESGEESEIRSDIYPVKVPLFQAPKITVHKKSYGENINYIQIKLKKYYGKKVEIQYRKGSGRFHKIALKSNQIKKVKGRFRIQYLSGDKILSLRVRTYTVKKGKKEYSQWSKVKKIII